MKEQIQLLKIIFDFLAHLTEEQINMLINKKAKLKLEIEKDVVSEPKSKICIDEVCETIQEFTTREEATEYINQLALLKSDLKAIARKYNIPLGSKATNIQITEKIIENVIGSKLKFDALLSTDLKNK